MDYKIITIIYSVPLFIAILSDLFPGEKRHEQDYEDLNTAVKIIADK